jgi:hypothetical protein
MLGARAMTFATQPNKSPRQCRGFEFQRQIGLFCDEWRAAAGALAQVIRESMPKSTLSTLSVTLTVTVDGIGNTSGYSYARDGHVLGPEAHVIIPTQRSHFGVNIQERPTPRS